MRPLLAIAFVVAAAPVFAQRTEVALLAGYTTSGSIDKKAAGISDLEVDGSFTWGVAASRFFSNHWGAEASWIQQQSGLTLGTSSASAELFDLTIGQLQGSVVYRFGTQGARLRPFVAAGLGAAFLSAPNLDSETKFSWAVGGGLRWFPSKTFGARLQARYTQIQLNDAAAGLCDPLGFCQSSLHQFEMTGGLALRF
jgi:opacity protein-like surface antigen